MKLSEVFGSPALTEATLKAYEKHYLSGWPVSTKLQLYNYARDAFTTNAGDSHALMAFTGIYEHLRSYWQVFRGRDVISYWKPAETFAALQGPCSGWGMGSELTLLSLEIYDSRHELQECFDAFGGIKRQGSGDYPWMAASKFLHFFNPRLFPVYDISQVWEVAMTLQPEQSSGVSKREE